MFAGIAGNYDRANALFSFGMHNRWNRALIKKVGRAEHLLDLCAGTGEIAFGFLNRFEKSFATLLDFCPEMLEVAQKKGGAFASRYRCIQGDAQTIALEAKSVDAVTISYGIRNVKDPQKCFNEVFRVLKPGGRFGILELTRPSFWGLRLLHRIHLKFILPLLGMAVAKDLEAYRYLSKSIESFSSADLLEKQLIEAGFGQIKKVPLLGGVATIILCSPNY